MKKKFSKKILYILIAILVIVSFYFIFKEREVFSLSENYSKQIILNDDGLVFNSETKAKTVGEFLEEKKIDLKESDLIFPTAEVELFSGTNIKILRARKFNFLVDGENIEGYALAKNVGGAISENNITLGRLDKAEPDFDELATNNLEITITRINIEEKIIPEDISFKIISKEDSKLGWQEKKVSQKGKKGILEVKYKITYKNGKEIDRVALSKEVTREPVNEINIQGTYMKLGKSDKGQASHYAASWGELNASRDLPRGSYAKVTNMNNGKSTIVKINDYGPQTIKRIIDLSYRAFTEIASSGQGIADRVKVEPILN